MNDYYVLAVLSLVALATLCWMAGVVKTLLAVALLGAALSLSIDPKTDLSPDSLLLSALLLSGDGARPEASRGPRRGFVPLLDLDPVGLLDFWGYPGELHHVTTDDGYILGIHRISGPRRADAGGPSEERQDEHAASRVDRSARRPVVILAHPLLSSSAEWLVAGPGKALSFLLADEGYDVWLFNVRGNAYSENHTTLSASDDAFWDFSFHEHALYDMPALIQYVVRETGEQKMQYVGFSMGTTIMFAMSSLRPDVAKHISLFTALGPATALVHSRSATFRALARASPTLMWTARMLRVRRFLPQSAAVKAAGEMFCADGRLTQRLCSGLINALSGRNDAQSNTTLLPYIISRTPSGTSFKNINHFSQCMHAGFQQYDYGASENMRRYGSKSPPKYNISDVVVPTRIHYGLNDHLADWRDVQPLCAQLPSLLSCDAVADPLWTHLDFVWGKDAPSKVYSRVIRDMKEFSGVVA